MTLPKKFLQEKLAALGYDERFDVSVPVVEFGDYATNIALVSKIDPEEIIKKLTADAACTEMFSNISSTPNRFINFRLSDAYLHESLKEIIERGADFGTADKKPGEKILLEYVSANPTGPLTVGNMRGGVFGDILANVLEKTGYEVSREYYINDVGKQVQLLGESVARRYLERKGKDIEFPEDNYQGDYIKDIAHELDTKGLIHSSEDDFEKLSETAQAFAVETNIKSIKASLDRIGIKFDTWFSEKSLHENGKFNALLNNETNLKVKKGDDDAIQTQFDIGVSVADPTFKDYILKRSNGTPTYILGDIAYSLDKLRDRKFDIMINIWGADHHYDVPRLKNALKELGYGSEQVEIILHQNVSFKGGVKFSKRKGQFILLDELIDEVGSDVVRFFFATKALNTHMEFDMERAKEQSKKNPVFYIQYANARIHSVLKKTKSEKLKTENDFSCLKEHEERALITYMIAFPELLEEMTGRREIHPLTTYALELATRFHSFYDKHRILEAEKEIVQARLGLTCATQNVLQIVLKLLGLSAPERM